ncbi:hypothetical protein Leryth_002994, partial [Lithospermum erythrorhizon]
MFPSSGRMPISKDGTPNGYTIIGNSLVREAICFIMENTARWE